MQGILVLCVLVLSIVACSGGEGTRGNTVAGPENVLPTQRPVSTQFPPPMPPLTPSEMPSLTPTLGPSPTPPTNALRPPTSTNSGADKPVIPTPALQPTPTPTSIPVPRTPIPMPEPTAAPTEAPTPTVTRVTRSSITRDNSPEVDASNVSALVRGNTAFAFDLYQAVNDSDGNLFFSPYSISLALAMAYAGARGDTERQMADTLHFDFDQDRLHPAFNALDLSLTDQTLDEDSDEFLLNVANSVWAQEGYGFLPEYLDTLALNYGEEVRPVDFRGDPEAASGRINDWVANETEQRIKDLIPPDAIDEFTRLVLANAIYFKAAWDSAFDERSTSNLPFYLLDGSERDVPMMRQQSNFRYAAANGYQAVELPYKGGKMAMTILLPDEGKFSEFGENPFPAIRWKPFWMVSSDKLVRLTMPKFEMESEFSLTDTLSAMGMPDAFDDATVRKLLRHGRTAL